MREFGNSFVKWFMFDNSLRRLLISLKIKRSDADQNISEEKDSRLIYSGNSLPLVTEPALQYVNRVEGVFNGAGRVYNFAYPLGLLALMIRDLHVYHSQPENRYGNTAADIFLGTSPNQNTWSTHFGKSELYLPSTLYWLPTVLIAVVLPAVSSAVELYRRRNFINSSVLKRDEYVSRQTWPNSRSSKLGVAPQPKIITYYQDELPNRAYSNSAEFNALWNDQVDLQVFSDFVDLLSDSTKHGGFYKSVRRLQILSNLAAYDEHDYQPCLAERGLLNDEDVAQVDEPIHSAMQKQANYGSALVDSEELRSQLTIRRKALENLKSIAANQPNYSYVNYLLWRMGKGSDDKKFSPVFLLPIFWKLWQYYAKIRLLELAIMKIKGLAEFYNNKKTCEGENKQWLYMSQVGRYECNVCGDWDFVTYQAASNAQTCLDALLSVNRESKLMMVYLPRILKHTAQLTQLDLSSQNWMAWPIDELSQFLLGFSKAGVTDLALFNLSTLAHGPYSVSQDRVSVVAKFINSTRIRAVDLHSQQLAFNGVMPILVALRNSSIEWLDLSSNNLDDQIAPELTQVIDSSRLSFLNLANNQLSDFSLEYFQNLTQATNLQSLNMANNQFTDFGTADFILSTYFPLTDLDFSYNQLGLQTASAVSRYSQNHKLNSFTCAACQFDDFALINMTNTLNTSSLDLSANNFGNEATADFFAGLEQTGTRFLTLNNIPLSEAVLGVLGQALPNTQLQGLILQNTGVSTASLDGLLAFANVSALQFLDISYNSLDNDATQTLSKVWQYPVGLVSIRVRSCDISDAAAAEFIQAASGSSLQQLDVTGNNIGTNFTLALARTLPQSKLTKLEMSSHLITEEALQELASRLPASSLKTLDLSSIDLSDSSALFLGAKLISGLPHEGELSDPDTDRDQDHAVGQAHAMTALSRLGLSKNPLSPSAQTLFCRIQAVTNLESSALGLSNINWRTCTSSLEFANASVALSFASVASTLSEKTEYSKNAAMLVMQLILLYSLYRMLIKPVYEYCVNPKILGRK